MINLSRITPQALRTEPFDWAMLDQLYSPEDAAELASTCPHDHFKTVTGNDGEKKYQYEARALIPMGGDRVVNADDLSDAWRALARDLNSPEYRAAMSALTGCDLAQAPLEVNMFHYGPGSSLGPHLDLATKTVTHAIYFNPYWDARDGGCLHILRSSDPKDLFCEVLPVVGNSAVLIRSEKSWHAVSPVVRNTSWSRRSITATFYKDGSPSTMWPDRDKARLHTYKIADM